MAYTGLYWGILGYTKSLKGMGNGILVRWVLRSPGTGTLGGGSLEGLRGGLSRVPVHIALYWFILGDSNGQEKGSW